MEISEITNPEEFEAMREEWNALVEQSANPLFFSRHEWHWTWWRHYGEGRPLHIVCVRNNGRLKAIFPLRTEEFRLKRLLRCRVAMPLGQGEASYQDAIIAKGFEIKALNALLNHAKEKRPEWEVLVLRKLHPASVWLSFATRSGPDRPTAVRQEDAAVPYIRLPRSSAGVEEGWSLKLRADIRRDRRKLESLGALETETVTSPTRLREVWPEFLELHEARWGLANLLTRGYARYRLFAYDLTLAAAEAGLLSFLVLRLRGAPVGYELCFDFLGTRYSFMRAWDPLHSKLGVGNVSLCLSIRDAIARGLDTYDFGGGSEKYKLSFAGHIHIPWSLVLPLGAGIRRRLVAWLECRDRR